MQIVPLSDTATLLPIIQQQLANGLTVWSDEWVAYNRIVSFPDVTRYGVVNHSLEFVNSTTKVHTQNVFEQGKSEP